MKHDIKAILADPEQRSALLKGAAEFLMALAEEPQHTVQKPTLTPDQYAEAVRESGTLCPVCGSFDVEGESFDVGQSAPGQADQDMHCLNCGSAWIDQYVIKQYIQLEERHANDE